MSSYFKFWGISHPVFSGTPLSTEIFLAPENKPHIEKLTSIASQPGTVSLITGESGIGKSSVARWLYDSLPWDNQEVLLTTLIKKEGTSGWIIPRLADYLGIYRDQKNSEYLLALVVDRLDQLTHQNRKLLILIDAAHLIASEEAFEDIVGLSNLQSLVPSSFSFLLSGREELANQIANIPEVATRITVHTKLPRLSETSTTDYIEFKCDQAGIKSPFRPDSVQQIFSLSAGVPAAINSICENALIDAWQQKLRFITAAEIQTSGITPATPAADDKSIIDKTKTVAPWVPPPPPPGVPKPDKDHRSLNTTIASNETKPYGTKTPEADDNISLSELFQDVDEGFET